MSQHSLPQQQPNSSEQAASRVAPALARLSLRYRPLADVLIGTVEQPAPDASGNHADEVVEVLDADTRLTWSVVSAGPRAGTAMLTAFELMHARTRWEADGLPMLHASLAARCMHEADQHAAAIQHETDLLTRMSYRGKTALELPLEWFRRSALAPVPAVPGKQVDALHVARALEALADGIEVAVARTPRPTFHDEHGQEYAAELDADDTVRRRVIGILHATRELASTLADHEALPAPGASAAARQALRGGLPLSFRERQALMQALTDVDHAAQWPAVARTIQSIADALTKTPTRTQDNA